MAKKSKSILQPYPRRKGAFERITTGKKGNKTSPDIPPKQLVEICLKHLKERSDPILSPAFLGQLELSDIFVMDAVSHEMQRHRMKIGEFYQFLVIELMKTTFPCVYDGKREGDVEAEVETPGFEPGLRLYISVNKSKDTVGGQDIVGRKKMYINRYQRRLL